MKVIRKWWWLLLVVALAGFIRVYRLAEVPLGVYYDEIDLAYQARSLLETGKDYRGTWSPFYLWSFHDLKTPIPIYMSIPAMALLRTPELQVRMTTALVGTAVVALAMMLTWMWVKRRSAAVLVGLVFALNPWLIQFSRISFEAIYALLFYFGFLIMFYRWLKSKKIKDFYLAIVLLSLGVYVYRIMSFYVPLTFLIMGVIYFKDIWKVGLKHLLIGASMAAVIILPFLYATTIAAPDKTRFEQLSIFSDPLVPIFVIRGREVDSGDYKLEKVGQKPVASSFLFHNKPLGWLSSLKNNYIKNISGEFLFVEGDHNLRQGMGIGALLLVDAIGLVAGIYWLIKNLKDKKYQFLAAWLITAPIPASLTFDGAYHASRLIIFAGPLLLVSGLGWWKIVTELTKWRWNRLALAVVAVMWLGSFLSVTHKYFVHFPLEAARSHGYGYKQAVQKIVEVDDKYEKVVMSNTKDPAMLYYLFWAEVPPEEVQNYGPGFTTEIHKNQRLDKYRAIAWGQVVDGTGKTLPNQLGEVLEPGVLYMVTAQDVKGEIRPEVGTLPSGVKIVEAVPYPDNSEVAFYLITKSD